MSDVSSTAYQQVDLLQVIEVRSVSCICVITALTCRQVVVPVRTHRPMAATKCDALRIGALVEVLLQNAKRIVYVSARCQGLKCQ